MLDYLTPQGYENEGGRKKFDSFDTFLVNRKNFEWKYDGQEDEWLTIDDLEKLVAEFLIIDSNHDDHWVYEKAEGRRNQYFYYSTKTFSTMVLKLIQVRDYLYDILSLPIKRDALETNYEKYLNDSATSFMYPAHKGLYEP